MKLQINIKTLLFENLVFLNNNVGNCAYQKYLSFRGLFLSLIALNLTGEINLICNGYSINVAKKEIEKAIIGELYKKEVIDFNQYNFIIRELDENVLKEEKENKKENLKQIIVDFVV